VERTTLAGPLPRGQWQIFRNPTAHRAHLAAREPATCYHELRAVQLRFVLQLPAEFVKALCATRTDIRAQVQLLTGKSETWARASRQAILVAYRELGRPEVSAQALGAIPAIGCGLHRGPAVVNSVQLKAMIAPYAWACALPGEACARMHCRPLYFQGLTVLCSSTESLIVRPLRRTPVSDRETGKTLSTCFT